MGGSFDANCWGSILYRLSNQLDHAGGGIEKAINGPSMASPEAHGDATWHPAVPGVWRSDFLCDVACKELSAQIQELKSSDPLARDQLNPEKGLPLMTHCGALLEEMVKEVDASLIQSRRRGHQVELKAAFAVEYADAEAHHQPHSDDSDLTLNVCIGEQFEGGELLVATDPITCQHVYSRVAEFTAENQHSHWLELDTKLMPTEPPSHATTSAPSLVAGPRLLGQANEPSLQSPAPQEFEEPMYVGVPHRVGQALVHAGQHMHGANPVQSGTRLNVVLWLSVFRGFPRFRELAHHVSQSYLRLL